MSLHTHIYCAPILLSMYFTNTIFLSFQTTIFSPYAVFVLNILYNDKKTIVSSTCG